MDLQNKSEIIVSAQAEKGGKGNEGISFTTHYKFEAFDKDGNPLWTEEVDNLVVDVGLDEALDKIFKASGYTAAWHVGLTDGTPTPAAGNTMSSHSGWAEVVAYSEAVREVLTLGTVSSQSVDNSASKASFSINANNTTIGGGFITTDNTKSGTSGILYGVSALVAGNKILDSGDSLNITITLTASAS